MPNIEARDGVTLYWESRGEGPAVGLLPYWIMVPSIFDPLERELAPAHTILRYEARGTGRSSRHGPYDLETDADDLEAVLEAAGGLDVAVCMNDAANIAVRVARRSPGLIGEVVCLNSPPFGIDAFSRSDSLVASETVVSVFMQQLETDFRGGIRGALAGANPELTDDEVRERVARLAEFVEPDAAVSRVRAWATDAGGIDAGAAIGPRLHLVLSDAVGGADAWFPGPDEVEPMIQAHFPEASIARTTDGVVSAPGEIAAEVRRVAASERAYDRTG